MIRRLSMGLALLCGFQTGRIVPAAEPLASQRALVEARFQQYQLVDYPLYARELDRQLVLAQAAHDAQARRVEDYRPFRSFGRYAATYRAQQNDQLRLLVAQQQVDRLQDQKNALWSQHMAYLLQLDVEFSQATALDTIVAPAHSAPR